MEVLADAVGSVGVLVAGLVMLTTGWGYADIVVAVCIALWVVPRALSLLVDAARILSQQAPGTSTSTPYATNSPNYPASTTCTTCTYGP